MRATIDDLLEFSDELKLVIFAGGEPTLLGEHLLDTIAYCDSVGLCTRVVTNASWAPTLSLAKRKIDALRNAGLMELNLSADDYHLPFIPFRNIANAWRVSKNCGFSAVVIANARGPRSTITPSFIMEQLGEDLPVVYDDNGFKNSLTYPSSDGTLYGISNAFLQNLGRSHETLADDVFFNPASQDSISGACPWAIRSAAVSPKNHLVACCGMEAENNELLDFSDLSTGVSPHEVFERANDDVLIAAIAFLGPAWLHSFLKSTCPSLPLSNHARSMCELCEHIVSQPALVLALRQHSATIAMAVLAAQEKNDGNS